KFPNTLYLAQEELNFSALYDAYVLYRVQHPDINTYAHKWLDVKFGPINTAVLIFSSLTAAWAVRAAQLGQKKLLVGCIAVTIGCALTFLGIKYVEYSHKVHEHILFGRYFDPCVSPGGAELLTKGNECAGTKSTVKWDAGTGKAVDGCFQIDKIDQNRNEEGLQADCQVSEIKLDLQKQPDGSTVEKELSSRPITERCAAPEAKVLAELAGKEEHGEEKEKFPCWRPAYQPAVCPDLIDGPADKTEGERRSAAYASHAQVGMLVEYGDHEERDHHTKIKAVCKPAPAAPAVADIGADPEAKTQLGKKLILDRPHALTTHQEHELESLGPPPEHTNMFFSIYFAMTGLHGVHVLFGVFVFTWLLIRASKGHFSADYFGPVDYAALYWHIVDLIWIFLFPLLYLIH
ncbi:MAG: cytochrome c oxidase subunit, partial [Myxococcales bacterium]|nr:cytochrome c oxidase subunit [Myxococcales bacterium]